MCIKGLWKLIESFDAYLSTFNQIEVYYIVFLNI